MPPGVPTTLYRKFVALTEGELNPSTLTWKGIIRKAPEMPAIEVKNEILNATIGGRDRYVCIPAAGKVNCNSSMSINF
jgi:hypothetical protein